MRGLSDKDMAEVFGITPSQMRRWVAFYPMLKDAIEAGRTEADVVVLQSVYKSAIGYSHPEEKLFMWDGEVIRADTVKHYKPDMTAAKLWLTNRDREHWKDRQQLAVSGGPGDNAPIGLRDETKMEVMSSILALIQPKPDGPSEPPKAAGGRS